MGGHVSVDHLLSGYRKNKVIKSTTIHISLEPEVEIELSDNEELHNPLTKYIGLTRNHIDGDLLVLMKMAWRTKKFDKVDEYIRTEVVKLLYNEGRGKEVKLN
jgi:hypothetical protein